MKKRLSISLSSLVLLLSVLLNLAGCSTLSVQAADLMEGVEARPVAAGTELADAGADLSSFAVRLFQACYQEKDLLISPYSVLCALAMTANGAKGETLAQMEKVLGVKIEDLNRTLYAYQKSLSADQALRPANSIWFTRDAGFTVEKDFLQTNADYYGAAAYQAPFDPSTLDAINNWVKEKTGGMIPKILDQIPKDAVMYLVNALAFEAKWAEIYEEDQVWEDVFYNADGTESRVKYLHGNEGRYLESENATGFLKLYEGGRYAFAALLPERGTELSDFISSLNGEELHDLLRAPVYTNVITAVPEFKAESELEMQEVLSRMGMPLAFDGAAADFSGLGHSDSGNICISRVLHKTFLELDAKGTKAAAATVVEMKNEAVAIDPEEPKSVILDRPFVYMLIDLQSNAPFFIGAVEHLPEVQ